MTTSQSATSHKERKALFEIVDFAQFESLLVDGQPLAFNRSPSNQVLHIRDFMVNRHRKCEAILIERHYIDRAFIEEYKEFYATSFKPYSNACMRLHFFQLSPSDLQDALNELDREITENIDIATEDKSHASRSAEYHSACRTFSEACYLGFMVVKPLPSTRIGRTIIRHPRHELGADLRRGFPCTRVYTAHVKGLELSVCGLPFQQQDSGMSACASTALWASMSQFSEYERIQVPTPAAITKFASTLMTNFGRSIPQERGLTSGQMCLAMEAGGLSPYLVPFEDSTDPVMRSLIYSVVRSGFAPILILRQGGYAHAVTVAGMQLTGNPSSENIGKIRVAEASGKLKSLYINDDRLGPYQVAELKNKKLAIETRSGPDPWDITHMLVPLHAKIRLASSDLSKIATLVVEAADNFATYFPELEGSKANKLDLEYWIMKSRAYRQHALYGTGRLKSTQARNRLNDEHDFSRYIGIVRISDTSIGVIDIIVDVTNTARHRNIWLVLGRGSLTDWGKQLVALLGSYFGARTLLDT